MTFVMREINGINIFPPLLCLLYSSWPLFVISISSTVLAPAAQVLSSTHLALTNSLTTSTLPVQYLSFLCKILSIFWVRIEMAVTSEETRTKIRRELKTF